ncbi:hypothetical protein RFI_19480 [Reticulomyxa filosa]|uniref:AMP-activated protein kinase glycogen-binding domain-containing protein n=1 Tax=Reticulomyxa filosa TaxID=46433 RepID=X6MXN0_RETFI|nr:hypothetical protein RFI_19480 [Reticulomyxa filosa]|eukprot:ETO17830.1 hypothetical protein RFI_19480 [Reticulomyxa filosa]
MYEYTQQNQVIGDDKSDTSLPNKSQPNEAYNQDDINSMEKYPTTFKWKYGGRDVYVAHSGDGFRLKHHMEKVDVQSFEVTLELPPGEYSYKYIVDNTWRCDPDTKKTKDEATGKWYNVVEVGETVTVEEAQVKETDGQYGQFIKDEQDYIRDPPIAPPQLGYILLNQQPERGFHPLMFCYLFFKNFFIFLLLLFLG